MEKVNIGLRVSKQLADELERVASSRNPPVTRQFVAVEMLAKQLNIDCDLPKVGAPKKAESGE